VKLARLKKDHAGAIASIALDRVVATLAMCCLGLAFGLVASRPGQSGWLLIMGIAMLGLATPFGWLLASRSRSWALAKRLRFGERFQPIRRIADAMRQIPRNEWGRILRWSLLAQLLGTLEYLALARSLDLELGFAALGWIRAVMLLATLVPITISGLGLREGAAVLVLTAYGVGPETALAYSLLVFAAGPLALGLAGGLLEALALLPRGRVRTH
jgi:hypothetical protein